MTAREAQRGVTLLELLIALAIFAFISSAAVYALRLAVDGRAQFDESDDRLRRWQIARLIMREDLAQLSPRVVRDEFGDRQGAAFLLGRALEGRPPVAGERPLAAFVRRGWDNPNFEAPRSELQYVEYLLKDGAIVRRTRPYLDAARDHAESDRVLFADVERARVEALAGETSRGLEWIEAWPGPGGDVTAPAPRAVRLTLVSDDYGEIEQLFWIGAVGGAP